MHYKGRGKRPGALANTNGTLAEQYALDPYGKRFAAERVSANGTLTNLDPLTGPATLLTRNGLMIARTIRTNPPT